MVALEDPALPRVGEPVRVAWGLASVAGHVVESYGGVNPRVVVEVDPGEVGDSSVTVTVPVAALEPLEDSKSVWARGVQYERAVAEALLRVSDGLKHVEANAIAGDHEVDLLGRLKDGRQLVVETKSQPVSERSLLKTLTQTRDVARTIKASWLVVIRNLSTTDADAIGDLDHVAVWNGSNDDSLRRALAKVLNS